MTVARNTVLGGVTGLVLGGTLTLVVDEDQRDDVVRWGVVIGTFGGFGLGIWAASRGQDDLFADNDPLGDRTLAHWLDEDRPSGPDLPGNASQHEIALKLPLVQLSW